MDGHSLSISQPKRSLYGKAVERGEVPPSREGQKATLGIGWDGVMVWVDDGWHEVKVGSGFEFGPGAQGEVEVHRMGYRAAYGEVIDGFVAMGCPKGVRMVNGYHAAEHLRALGREAYGQEATKWVEYVGWKGKVEAVIRGGEAVLVTRRGWSEGVARTADYFRERADPMRYPDFRALGYPIEWDGRKRRQRDAWRCKNRGQRWEKNGLVAILALHGAGMGGADEWHQAWERIR